MYNNFVVFSDPHFYSNPSKSELSSNGISTWLEAQVNIVRSIYLYCAQHDIKTVVINGDLFEEKNRIPIQTYNIVWKLLKEGKEEYDISFIINTGNHDFISTTLDSSLQPISEIATVVSVPSRLSNLTLIPYGKIDDIYIKPESDKDILFLHEEISGLTYGEYDYETPGIKLDSKKLQDLGWQYIFNGHIHKPQEIGNIINIGSIMRQDWGEANDVKRFVHYKNGKVKSINIDCPKFIQINSITELEDYKQLVTEAEIDQDYYNFYRIDVSSDQLDHWVFNKFNITPRVTVLKKREARLKDTNSVFDDITAYIEMKEPELDIEKLKRIGKEFYNENRPGS